MGRSGRSFEERGKDSHNDAVRRAEKESRDFQRRVEEQSRDARAKAAREQEQSARNAQQEQRNFQQRNQPTHLDSGQTHTHETHSDSLPPPSLDLFVTGMIGFAAVAATAAVAYEVIRHNQQ